MDTVRSPSSLPVCFTPSSVSSAAYFPIFLCSFHPAISFDPSNAQWRF